MDVKKVLLAAATIAPFFLLSWPPGSLRLQITGARLPPREEALPSYSNNQELEQSLESLLKSDSLDVSKLAEILSQKPNLRFRFPQSGATPLTLSIRQRWPASIIRTLLEAGADPSFRDSEGLTPLAHLTLGWCDEDDAEAARALLEKSAAVSSYLDFTAVYGATYYTLPFEVWRETRTRKISLIESALYHNKGGDCIKLLLAHGAAVDRYAYALWKETRQDLEDLDLHRPLF